MAGTSKRTQVKAQPMAKSQHRGRGTNAGAGRTIQNTASNKGSAINGATKKAASSY